MPVPGLIQVLHCQLITLQRRSRPSQLSQSSFITETVREREDLGTKFQHVSTFSLSHPVLPIYSYLILFVCHVLMYVLVCFPSFENPIHRRNKQRASTAAPLLQLFWCEILWTVLAGSHLGGTCHPQWPEDEPGCRSAFRCFRLLLQYDLLWFTMIYYDLLWFTVLTNDLQRQQCCSGMPHPSWHVPLSSISWRLGRCPWGQENNQASNGHVSYCYTAQAMLIVVLLLWTKQTKHEPQIVALSMLDPTSMNHVDSVLPYISLHRIWPLTSWSQPWHPWLHCMATHIGSCRGAPEIKAPQTMGPCCVKALLHPIASLV